MSSEAKHSRRELLRGSFGTLLAIATTPACKRESGSLACSDTSGLAVTDVAARTALGYAETAPDPTHACSACQQFVPGPSESACGTCKVLRGSIHPNGGCKAFAAKS